jgi:hypothetical protein
MIPARHRLLSVVLLLVVAACDREGGRLGLRDPVGGAAPTPPVAPVLLRIDYRVIGTIRNVKITYFSAIQGTTQTITDLPWAISYQTANMRTFVYLAAEAPLDNVVEGSLIVQIFLNGMLFREARGSGFQPSVAVSGETP